MMVLNTVEKPSNNITASSSSKSIIDMIYVRKTCGFSINRPQCGVDQLYSKIHVTNFSPVMKVTMHIPS